MNFSIESALAWVNLFSLLIDINVLQLTNISEQSSQYEQDFKNNAD